MSQLYSRCLVFPASFLPLYLLLAAMLWCFFTLCTCSQCSVPVHFLFSPYCLACRYTLKHTHTFSPSLPSEEVLLFPGRLGGLVVERWGRREGEIEEVHMVKLQKRNNSWCPKCVFAVPYLPVFACVFIHHILLPVQTMWSVFDEFAAILHWKESHVPDMYL